MTDFAQIPNDASHDGQTQRHPDDWFCDPVAPELRMRRVVPTDNAQLLELVGVPMPSNGVMVSMQRQPSYFKASHTQYTDPQPWVIVSEQAPDLIMAMYNLGERPCYINGQIQLVRYVGDLRVNPNVRGKGLVHLMMKQLATLMQGDDFAQTLILADNHAARRMLHQTKSGFPPHYQLDDVSTLTMTGLRHRPSRAIQQAAKTLDMRTARAEDASDMTAFIQQMSAHYNVMPAYDFAALQQQTPYWTGLQFSDFTLVLHAGKLVGLFGLWNQSSFKQTCIADYSRWIGLARPVYNVWAKTAHRMQLPKRGQRVSYLMLHSALCDPKDISLFEIMLREAYRQTEQRGYAALCYSLAAGDPRLVVNRHCYGEVIRGLHAFHSFGANPLASFDRQRVSYIECGRV